MSKTLFLVILIVTTLGTAYAELPQYVIRDLGTFGRAWAEATGINERGQLVGVMGYGSVDYRAFLFDGQMVDLGPGTARDINESGVVAGSVAAYMAGYTADGFVWDGQRHDVVEGQVLDINARGDLVGYNDPEYQAFVLADGVFVDIHLPGAETSMARGINDSGHVVFNCDFGYVYNVYSRAYIWDGKASAEIGTFGGESSTATDINNAGNVVGWAQMADGGDAGFLWDGTLHNIGRGLYPAAINGLDRVVGSNAQGGFIWANGVIQSLPSLGGAVRVRGINDGGVIVGSAVAPDGTGHAVIWVPVPEPASLAVLGCGLILAVTSSRLRSRSN